MMIKLHTLTGQVIRLPGQEKYIEKLHEYNEIKDFCLALLGKLALMHGTTVGSLYSKFGLDPDD